jgi:hypothetical protein
MLLKAKPLLLQYLAERLGAFISKLIWSSKHFEIFNSKDLISDKDSKQVLR